MLTSALLLLMLATSPNLEAAPKYKAWVKDHEVWTQTDAGDRQVLYDPLAAEPAAASPSGDQVVYAVLNPVFDAPHCGNRPQKYMALVRANVGVRAGAPVYEGLDLNVPWQNFDIAHELTTKGIQKFVADYRSTLKRSA